KNEQLRKAAREAVRKLKELELTTKMVSKEKKEVERQFKLPLDQAGQNTMVLDEQKHGLVTPITHFLSTTVCQLDEKGKTRLQLRNSGNAPIILNKGAKVATGELKELNVLTEEGKVEEVLEMWIEAGASDIDDKGVLCASGSIDRQLTQVHSMKGEVEEVLEMWIGAGASDIDDKEVLCASGSIDLKLTQVQSMEGEVEKVLEMWIGAGASDIDHKGVLCASGSIDLKLTQVQSMEGEVEEVLEMWIGAGASDIDDKGVLCASGSIDLKLTQVQSMEGEVEEVLEMWIGAGASDIDDKGVLCASGSIDLKLTQLQNTEIEKVITEKTRDQNLWKQVERDKPIVAGDTRKLITEHKDVSVISNDELGQTNLTKYAISVPLPDKKAQTVEQAFIERCGLEERRLPTKLLKGKEKDLEISQFQKPKILHIKQCPTKGDTSRINGRDSKHPIIMEGEDAVGIVQYWP
uniref:Uncharacterized protein n=1 Tax=Caenorhabditis japonica TaxID=281687 RepID=A0A8R1EQJ2_CAEJA